ncbi:hypothetical protein RCS94_02205 [Orbaceae bacterium ac157xtp]
MIAPSSYGALSAMSANTIQGNKPGFSGQSGAKKLGFKVGNISYSEANPVLGGSNTDKDKIEPGTPKVFERTLKLNEFVVQGLTVNDFTVANDYFDADGDEAATPAFTVDGVSHEWWSGNVKITDESKMIGCGSGLSLPLTLKIKLDAKAYSKYGDPRVSDASGLEQSYQITTTPGICFAKPGSLTYYGGTASRDPVQGGGYTADFDPANGFRANPTESRVKFPTTAFSGARFQLVMTGRQTDYTYNVITNPNSAAIVDTNGWVTINNKPTGAITVRVTSKPPLTTSFDYEFNPTSLWVVPKGTGVNYAQAKTICGDESKIPTRAQLTNSPQNTIAPGATIPYNYYTRAIGKLYARDSQGSLTNNVLANENIFGEWGHSVNHYSVYPGSSWYRLTEFYWTREAWSNNYQFVVNSGHGLVAWPDPNGFYGNTSSVCLE